MRVLDSEALREKGIRYSRVQLWRMVRAGSFPRPLKLGPSRNVWLESEVEAWLQSRVDERDRGAA